MESKLPDTGSSEDLEKLEIKLFLQGIYEWYGYDYRNYSYHSIRRRIWHRIQAEGISHVLELLEKVLHDPSCMQRLIADFSINVTEMFRDPLLFYHFRKKVVPILRTYPSIRIWHAGCSTGEEVYSMAILLHEEGLYDKAKIYATDMNSNVLRNAKNREYPIFKMKKYTKNYLKAGGKRAFSEYYKVKNNKVEFHSSLSKNIVFAQHNLVTDRSFNEFHVILCRNVLIYFNYDLQNSVHQLFYESLAMSGILVLGDKERISFLEKAGYYKEIDGKQKLYQKVR